MKPISTYTGLLAVMIAATALHAIGGTGLPVATLIANALLVLAFQGSIPFNTKEHPPTGHLIGWQIIGEAAVLVLASFDGPVGMTARVIATILMMAAVGKIKQDNSTR